jgi:leader peptidase (prepilin peptidase)/N-methyltransferase
MGLLFVGLYAMLFMADTNGWWGEFGGYWWHRQSFLLGWPGYMAFAVLLAALWSMTVIDAKTFLIPIQIPVFASIAAMVLWTVQGAIAKGPGLAWPMPVTHWPATIASLLGLGGVLLSTALVATGRLRPSFVDYEDFVPEGETLADYPHARREMGIELLFLVPCFIGLGVGWWWGTTMVGSPPVWLQALGGSVLGYLIGGAVVWGVRILGTLGFGREAMGMGDVHLLAAVGAVTGWFVPLLAFFIAPFLGLAWAGIAGLLQRVDGRRRELPYGPHLAIAVVAIVVCWPLVQEGWRVLVPTVEMPKRELAPSESESDALMDWTLTPVDGSMPVARDGYRATTRMPISRRLNRWL